MGVVDSDYVVHLGLPTLGANETDKVGKIISMLYKYQLISFINCANASIKMYVCMYLLVSDLC